MRRALIFCADPRDPYKPPGVKSRHLLKVDGEPVLYRTVRQLRERGFEPALIAKEDLVPEVAVYPPKACRWWCETALSTQELWKGQMVGVLGDVWFSDAAMDELCALEGLHFQGRQGISPLHGGAVEMFGMTWEADDKRFIEGLFAAMDNAVMRDPGAVNTVEDIGTPWIVYRACIGVPLNSHQFDRLKKGPDGKPTRVWVDRHDWTDDMTETEGRFRYWQERYAKRFVCQHMALPLPE